MTRLVPTEGQRILIVDDEKPISRLLQRIVERAGHRATLAHTAAAARAALDAATHALVLCDLTLPDGSGLDLLRHVRAAHPTTATLVVTGADDAATAQAALELGAYGYVIKPFEMAEIAIGVASALRRRALELESARHSATLEAEVVQRTAELRRALTDLQRTTDELRERDERFRSLAECSPTLILLFDVAGRCVYANAAAAAVAGVASTELLGSGWRRLVHPDDLPAVLELAGVKGTPEGGAFEHRVLNTAGEIRWLRVHLAPTCGDDGRPTGYVSISEDITDIKATEAELRRRAATDDLTGLPNRAALFDLLDELASSAPSSPAGVLFVDVDRFKLINDSHGHVAGDHVLGVVARRLSEIVAGLGTVVRLGGDEFVVVVDAGADPRSMVALAETILRALRAPIAHHGADDAEFLLAGSVGIAFSKGAGADLRTVLADADIALQRAKAYGGNGFEIFDEQMRLDVARRLEVEAGLRRAVAGEEFVLHYQPEFAADGSLAGFEALIRWEHPVRGRISPAEFVPVAEETGLVVPMGRWVLFDACAQAARWNAGRAEPLMVSVNLSARQLRDPVLFDTVAGALTRSGLDGRCLVLEITESVIMEDADETVVVLERLRDLGIRVAIDDFGTGYSSLGYLSELPVDFLKIDRRFVEGLGERASSENIVRAVIEMAHALHLAVVAEGIERPEQLTWLRDAGCDLLQGFHLGRPEEPDRYDALVAGDGDSGEVGNGRPRVAALPCR